ncbi:MAG: hypothetical protein Ct9H300mP15_21070 [Gemmatimonadota bacterium]|nr:MAG: hypothetical protein Ct9H300mP15_21070 [Gemmatimonadota bacterium]
MDTVDRVCRYPGVRDPMAADLALESEFREVAVIGCGVAGLTTARQLQRRGFSVTIYALSVPPDTTSNMSLAAWTPTSGLVDRGLRTSAWDLKAKAGSEDCLQTTSASYRAGIRNFMD